MCKYKPDDQISDRDRRNILRKIAANKDTVSRRSGMGQLTDKDQQRQEVFRHGAELISVESGHRADEIASAIHSEMPWMGAATEMIWQDMRASVREGDPESRLSKLISATYFLWAGLAVGVVLAPFDYLFLMVFAGFSLVLSRFGRVPGGFVIGSAFAFSLLGVPEEQALLMILFNWMISISVVVGGGLIVLWQSELDIRRARLEAEATDGRV